MTEYINTINVKGTAIGVGGEIADGQWILKKTTVFSSTKFTETGNKTYEVSSYLPDNTYTYEILISSYNNAGYSTIAAGDTSSWWLHANGYNGNVLGGYSRCTTTSNTIDQKQAIIPAKQSNNILTITVYNSSVGPNGTNNCGLYLIGYRRVGTNP